MGALLQDLRYGLRMFRTAPIVYGVAVLSIALGIGANTAIFSVIDTVLLKALPFPEPEPLVVLFEKDNSPNGKRLRDASLPPGLFAMSSPNFHDIVKQNEVLQYLSGWGTGYATVAVGDGDPVKVWTAGALDKFFEALNVKPILGRTFLTEEQEQGRNQEVILSYGLWAEWFQKDPKILGRTISFEGKPHQIVGVMPPGFGAPEDVQMWHPAAYSYDIAPRNFSFIRTVGRLKPGVSLQTAQASLDRLAKNLEAQYPETNKNRGLALLDMREFTVGDLRPALLMLWGAVGFVLLIACGNVANLLLVRAGARQREIAVRTAIGAGRGRLARQFLVESVLISIVGGILGLGLAYVGLKVLLPLVEAGLPRAKDIHIDLSVLGFTAAASLLCGILFGLAPVLRASRPDITEALKAGGNRSSTGSSDARALRYLLIVAQVSIAVTLVVGAALLIKSYQRLSGVDPGFKSDHVLTMEMGLPTIQFPDQKSTSTFFKDLMDRIQRLPGVNSVGSCFFLPLSGDSAGTAFEIEGRPTTGKSQADAALLQAVTPGYFQSIGIPLVRGRLFTERDDANAPGVVLIDETAVKRFWPNEDPIGKKIKFAAFFGPSGEVSGTREIVGIVGKTRFAGLDQALQPQIFFPNYQSTWRGVTLTVRTTSNPKSLVGPIREQVRQIRHGVAFSKIRTLDEVVSGSIIRPRFNTLLMLIFGAIALSLAAVGIFGMVAFSVGQRSQEIAIRLALGAERSEVLRLLLLEGVGLGLIGLVIGISAAVALTRFMTSMLYDIKPTDPGTYVAVVLVVFLMLLLASYLPARRALKIQLVRTLQAE